MTSPIHIEDYAFEIVKKACELHPDLKMGVFASAAIVAGAPILLSQKSEEKRIKMFTYVYRHTSGRIQDYTISAASRAIADGNVCLACPDALKELIEVKVS